MNILADAANLTGSLSAVEVGVAAAGAAIGIGVAGAGAAQAVGRNPGAMGLILGAALIFVGIAEGTFILVAFVLAK